MPDCYKVKIVLFRILIVILEASVVSATRHRGKICGGKRFQAGGLKSGTDFNTWVQCFAIYAAVLIAKSPERAPFLPAICLLWPNSAKGIGSRRGCCTTGSSAGRRQNWAG